MAAPAGACSCRAGAEAGNCSAAELACRTEMPCGPAQSSHSALGSCSTQRFITPQVQ